MNNASVINETADSKVKPTRGPAQLLGAFFMLLKSSNNLLYLSILTTFLDKAGPGSLPWVYLLVNVIFIVVQFQFMTRIVGREGHWLLNIAVWPAAAVSFVVAATYPVETAPVLIGLLITAMLSDLITNQAFSAMLNHFLSVSEARRVLPMIFAAGSFGFIISGLLLKFVIDFVGFTGLLTGNGLMMLLSGLILLRLKPFEEARLAEAAAEESASQTVQNEAAIEESSVQHPLARLLIASSFLIIFNKYLVDFLFAASLSSYFTASNDLAAFMGVFAASADFVVIGMQTFVMHRIFAAFPIGRVLAFMPIVLTVFCLVAAVNLKFAIIATVQFMVLLNSKNFTVPATTILMGAVPQKSRVFYRRDMSIACSISSAVVGVFLLLARDHVTYDTLFLGTATLYLVMAVVHYQLDAAYLKTLRRAIVNKDEELDADQIASLRFVQLEERILQLRDLLQDSNARVRNRAIEECASLPPKMIAELLEPMLARETDSRCLNAVTRILLQTSPESSMRHIIRLLEETSDERLRSDIIETIGNLRSHVFDESLVVDFLDYQHHRVVASAVISSVRLTRNPTVLERAMKKLAIMATHTEDLMRASAAAVMGELGLPLFIPALSELAGEKCPVVANNAASALARIQTPAAVAALENMLFHEDNSVVERVEQLLAVSTRDNIAQISRLLPGITAEERRKLSTRLRSGRHAESHDLLAAILCIETPETRKNLIHILEKADKQTIQIMQKCIRLSENSESAHISIAPVLGSAIDDDMHELPEWTAVLSAMASGMLEKPDRQPDSYHAVLNVVSVLWHEMIAVSELGCSAEKCRHWRNRAFNFIRLIASLSSEPATMIKSCREIVYGKSYERSMALEFFEARAGRTLSEQILPLLNNDSEPMPPPLMLMQMAAKCHIAIDDTQLDKARDRISQNLSDRAGLL